MKLLIEPHYFPSIEYFVLFKKFDHVILEIHEHYIKQTYRNRCYILTSNDVLSLSVPVIFGNTTILKDVKIDYHGNWSRDHTRSIRTAYGKSPFFEFYSDTFLALIEKKWNYLLDFKLAILTKCLEILNCGIKISTTDRYEKYHENDVNDLRNHIQPKKSFSERKIYVPSKYIQTFGNKFVPNLSLLDVLMCEGPNAFQVLRASRFEE